MIVSARIMRLTLAVACALAWQSRAHEPTHAQSPIVMQEHWSHPAQVGTEWESLMVAAILVNDSKTPLQIRRITVSLRAGDRTIATADASACAVKSMLAPGERTACYTEVDTSESERVDDVRLRVTAVEATAVDAARFAQPPEVLREVLERHEDYTSYDAELRNPGPAAYRSSGDTWTGALRAIAVFRGPEGILQVDASPLVMRRGHVPVGELLYLSSFGSPRTAQEIEEVEVFYGMLPVPAGTAPVDWEVADMTWSVDAQEEGEVLNISATVTNRSEITAEAAVAFHLLEENGAGHTAMAYSDQTVGPGEQLPFAYSSRVRETGYFDFLSEVRVHVSSMALIDVPVPPSPTAPPTQSPIATPTSAASPAPARAIYVPIVSR